MKVSRTTLLAAAVTAALTLFVAACSGRDSPAASQPTVAPSPTADTAAIEKKAMEDKAMAEKAAAEKKAMEDKAMEDKALAEKAAMEKKAMEDEAMKGKLPDQQFAAHFVDSDPKHGATVTKVPGAISLNFNFTLSDVSSITVTKDGQQVNSGKPTFASNKLSMTISVPSGSGSGTYIVDYMACWPDNSCHKGKFAFTVGL